MREPREPLSPLPSRDLRGPPPKPALDVKTLDQRAADQAFGTSPDEALPPAMAKYQSEGPSKHPRVKYRPVAELPVEHDSEPSAP
ncbi:hypothetical protein [Pseudomonas sp.]|uniref:hypothetical protein n=1 Tax=Pseudomonas sp. TaxID=306 RepID=UPI0030F39015